MRQLVDLCLFLCLSVSLSVCLPVCLCAGMSMYVAVCIVCVLAVLDLKSVGDLLLFFLPFS